MKTRERLYLRQPSTTDGIVTEFLIDKGANIEHISKLGETPLMEAVVHRSHRCLQLLLNKGAKYSGTNAMGNTILHLAALNADIDTLRILTDHMLKDVNEYARNEDGLKAIEIAQEQVVTHLKDIGTRL